MKARVRVRVRGREKIGQQQPLPATVSHVNPRATSTNLFARLSPNVARKLHSSAQARYAEEFSNNQFDEQSRDNKNNLWIVSSTTEYSTQVESGVEFLPLKISFSDKSDEQENPIIYASYNGGSIVTDLSGVDDTRRSEEHDAVIELDEALLPATRVDEIAGSFAAPVIVEALPHIYNAESVHLEPVSASDWELFEIHADELEAGSLLSQVCVVYPGQLLPILLGRFGDTAWVKVKKYCFSMDNEEVLSNDYDSDLSIGETTDSGSSYDEVRVATHECMRLVADTEVIVIPKTRQDPLAEGKRMPIRRLVVHPTDEDYSKDMRNLFEASRTSDGSDLVVCPPWFSSAIHPNTMEQLLPKGKDNAHHMIVALKLDGKVEKQCAISRLLTDENVPPGAIALHPALRQQINAIPLESLIHAQLISLDAIEISHNMCQSQIDQGQLSIDLVPVSDFATKSTSNATVESAPLKPWRLPSSVSDVDDYIFDGMFSVKMSDIVSLDMAPCIPACANTILPKELLEDFTILDSNHKCSFYAVQFVWDKLLRDKGNENAGTILPFSTVIMNRLTSLIESSCRRTRQQKMEDSNPDRSATTASTKTYLNILPLESICVNNTVHEAFDAARHFCSSSSTNFLVTGEEGSGKTHFALLIAALCRLHFGIATSYLDCSKLQSSPDIRMRNILDELSEAFKEATANKSTILVLDNIHCIVPNTEDINDDDNDTMHHQQTNPALSSQVKLISDHLRYLLSNNDGDIRVLGTCAGSVTVVPTLRSLRGFSSVLEVPTLDCSERETLFTSILNRLRREDCKYFLAGIANLVPSFGKQTEGYVPVDLYSLAGRVSHLAHIQALGRDLGVQPATTEERATDLLQEAIAKFTPLSQQSLQVSKQDEAVTWSCIGALFQAKNTLTDVILRPVRYRAIYDSAPISLPRGILLYGPSGCGKSLIVPALASECTFNIVKCNGPELLDKYIGASEAKVRKLFARAYAAAPCILFLDDFDALAPRRGTDHTGVTDRVVNQLLTFLDGVEGGGDKMVYIIGATSRPDKIDPALLRPGRLEKHVYLGYADSDEEWSDLLSKISSSRGIDNASSEYIASGKLLKEHGGNMKHLRRLSAADLKAVMDTAHLAAVHEYLESTLNESGTMSGGRPQIERRHIIDALRSARPSLSEDDRRMFASIYAPFYGFTRQPPLGDFGQQPDGDFAASGFDCQGSVGNGPVAERKLKTTLR